jgi:hypothetical protein
MGEVDQFNDAVDHGVAQGDQGVDAAPGQTAEKQLEENIPKSMGWSALRF